MKKDKEEILNSPDQVRKGSPDVRKKKKIKKKRVKQKGALDPKKLDVLEDSWWKGSLEYQKLDFAEYNWVSVVDNRRVSVDSKRSSVDSKRGSADSKRGSADSNRGSADSKRGSADSNRGSADSKRGSADSKRGSADSKKSFSPNKMDFSEDRDISQPALSRARAQQSKVPWALMRALGRFKLSLPDLRRYYNLTSHDPLALDKDRQPREKSHMATVRRKFWGNQQPLSKIPYKILIGHDHIVSSCHFCMNDTRFLSSSYDCSVKLWDAEDGTVVWDFEPRPKAPVLECSITADNRRIVASSYDKTVRAWDVETGQLLWKVRHDTFVVCCKFSPNGKFVLSALDVDRGIYLMDPENITTVIHMKDHHQRSITSCCFDPDSQKVASVSMDRCIKIWDITSRTTLFTIPKAHFNAISDCCFTSSGHFLCTSSWDKNIKIWNVHTGEFRNRGACVTLMKGHEGCVSSCCIARDSSFLISGGFDKTVAIWDVGGGYRKLALKGHEDWVTDVAISNNKKWILSASKDSSMRLWNIEEIDKIPLVSENKKAMGLKVRQCRNCDQLFSTLESDLHSQLSSMCLFCRREEKCLLPSSSSSSSSSLSLEKTDS
ncbi:WD repeat-containing protein 88 isoform X1 [Mus caroli]|uniref:WD repeat-containing protein 88 isoform X1 n=1 Tax=Mus caroli TaxID=10089 RepID=A0A6P5Q5K2_MUSCR|nr:WD repeat-containing protein 88 isoform X1 [Mus caroli]